VSDRLLDSDGYDRRQHESEFGVLAHSVRHEYVDSILSQYDLTFVPPQGHGAQNHEDPRPLLHLVVDSRHLDAGHDGRHGHAGRLHSAAV